LRGSARLATQNFPGAERDFAEAIELDGNNAQLFAWRGAARAQQHKLEEADADLTAAIDRRTDAQTLFTRGCVRLDLGRNVEAEHDFTTALNLGSDQDKTQLFVLRGTARARQHKLEEADADLTAAVDRRADAQTLFIRGCVRLDQGRYIEAEDDFTTASNLDFDQASLFTFRGAARLLQEKITEADDDAAAAFAGGATDILAYSLRSAVRLAQDRYSDAEPDLTAAIRLGRNDAWVLFSRGRARQAAERYAEAEQDYSAAIALGSDAATSMGITSADVLVSRGRTRLAQQKWSEAEQDFLAATKAGRDDAFVHVSLARALQEQKRYLEAETEFDLGLARESQPIFHLLRGYLRLIRGNFFGAEHDFSERIAREPDDANVLRARGLSRLAQRKYTEAIADYDAALALSPNETGFLGERMLAHLRLGNSGQATKDWVQLKAIDSEGGDTEGYSGVLQLAHNDFDSALKHLSAASLSDSSWFFWQGLVLLLVGRLEEAREAYTKASRESTPADILIALGQLEITLQQHPTQTASAAVRSVIGLIKAQLCHQVNIFAHSGDRERSIRSIMNTNPGDHERLLAPA
jgi:tetratricopeptide (TPR) repeat protein